MLKSETFKPTELISLTLRKHLNAIILVFFCLSIYVGSWRWNWQLERFEDYVQVTDLRHYYYAGKAFLAGASPYLTIPVPGLEAQYGFDVPFFYPPYTLPVFSILSLFSIEDVKLGMYLINYLSFHFAFFILLKLILIKQKVPSLFVVSLLLIQIFVISSFFWPPIYSAKAGNLHSVFFLAAVIFTYSMVFKRGVAQTISLVFLLFKPHYGIPFLVMTLLDRDSRKVAVVSLTILILFLIASIHHLSLGSLELLQQYMDAIEIYTTLPANNIDTRIGQIAIFHLLRIDIPTFFLVFMLIAVPVLIKVRKVRDPIIWIYFVGLTIVIFAPARAEDYIFIIPVLLLLSKFPLSVGEMITMFGCYVLVFADTIMAIFVYSSHSAISVWTSVPYPRGYIVETNWLYTAAVLIMLVGNFFEFRRVKSARLRGEC